MIRVFPSVAKPGTSVISNPAAKHARFPAVQKRESHTPFLSDQSFGDEPHQLGTDDRSRVAKSHEMQKQVESYDDKSTGNVHTLGMFLGCCVRMIHSFFNIYRRPPLPPPSLDGRGSYVWVPHDAPVEEENTPTNLTDHIAEDRMTGSDDEDEYIDPHAADYTDIPEDIDFDNTHISVNEEEEDVVWVILCNRKFHHNLTWFCSKQSSGVAGPSSDTVYLEDIDPRVRQVSA